MPRLRMRLIRFGGRDGLGTSEATHTRGGPFVSGSRSAHRHDLAVVMMPVFFLSTGLRTNWTMGGEAVFVAAGLLLVASVAGKLIGVRIAGRILNWAPGEASIIGWLLQTKALIMIIFANILLDKQIITSEAFTALLLMAIASTMLTVPMVAPRLARMKEILQRTS